MLYQSSANTNWNYVSTSPGEETYSTLMSPPAAAALLFLARSQAVLSLQDLRALKPRGTAGHSVPRRGLPLASNYEGGR
jgi:hypothetical protein